MSEAPTNETPFSQLEDDPNAATRRMELTSRSLDDAAGEPSSLPRTMPRNEAQVPASSSFPYSSEQSHTASSLLLESLTAQEVAKLRQLLARGWPEAPRMYHDKDYHAIQPNATGLSNVSADSDYPVFGESTHAWAIFAGSPHKRAGKLERLVGLMIICFQLFTYWMFASEAIEDYGLGQVFVTTSHGDCLLNDESPSEDTLSCDAQYTNDFDAFVAFFMLGIFLAGDFIQSFKVIRLAESGSQMVFAGLAVVEVVAAYLSASIAVSYNLYIGEVTDAVEVGVGLLFIRELSQRAYAGLQDGGKVKQYKVFFGVLTLLVVIGMIMDPLCEYLFAKKDR